LKKYCQLRVIVENEGIIKPSVETDPQIASKPLLGKSEVNGQCMGSSFEHFDCRISAASFPDIQNLGLPYVEAGFLKAYDEHD